MLRLLETLSKIKFSSFKLHQKTVRLIFFPEKLPFPPLQSNFYQQIHKKKETPMSYCSKQLSQASSCQKFSGFQDIER